MSFLKDDDDQNNLQLPVNLANAIKSAASPDRRADGDSPPPSRPAPQFDTKRRRQYKSTENVSKSNQPFSDPMGKFSEDEMNNSNSGTISWHRPQTGSRSGWGEDQGNQSSSEGIASRGAKAGRRSGSTQGTPHRSAEDIHDESDHRAEPPRKHSSRGSQDGVMVVIPDLDDAEDDEMITTVAAPPSLKVNQVRTIRELDADLSASTGLLSESAMSGVDLSYLSAFALCPPEQVFEDDKCWEWDVVFTEVASEFPEEEK